MKFCGPRTIFLVHGQHSGIHCPKFDVCKVCSSDIYSASVAIMDSGIQHLRAYIEHLTHLFAQSHLLQLFLNLIIVVWFLLSIIIVAT